MNTYYVYSYRREKDSIRASANTPYYIGKGKGRRAWSRQRRVQRPKNSSLIIIEKDNLTEAEAHSYEKELIALWGRVDNGTGILHNLSDGGEGSSGAIRSARTKKILSEQKKNKKRATKQCPYCQQHISLGNYSRYHGDNCLVVNTNRKIVPKKGKCKYCNVIMDMGNLSKFHNENCVIANPLAMLARKKSEPMSTETRNKISASLKSRPRSIESIEKQKRTIKAKWTSANE